MIAKTVAFDDKAEYILHFLLSQNYVVFVDFSMFAEPYYSKNYSTDSADSKSHRWVSPFLSLVLQIAEHKLDSTYVFWLNMQ